MKNSCILLVDDNPDDVILTQRAFKKAGLEFRIQVAKDGHEAMNWLAGREEWAGQDKAAETDLVLLDLGLPKCSGVDVLAWIRKQPNLTHMPVVILTSSRNPDDIKKVYELGANAYLIKPVFADALAETVMNFLTPIKDSFSTLLIDDSPDDRELAIHELRREFPDIEITEAKNFEELEAAINQKEFDLVITDFHIPLIDGISNLRVIKSRWPDCPVIMLTGTGSVEIAAEAIRYGLDDYVIKSAGHCPRLITSVRSVLTKSYKRKTMREFEYRYKALINQIPGITYTTRLDNKPSETFFISPQIEILGFTQDEWMADPGIWKRQLHPDDIERVMEEMHRACDERRTARCEYRIRSRDGRIIWFRDEAVILRDENDQPTDIHGIILDVTDRKQAEESLKSRLMELEAIANISENLRMASDNMGIKAVILNQVMDIVKAGAVGISSLISDDGDVLIELGIGAWADLTGLRIPRNKSISAQVITSGRPFIANDPQNDPRVPIPDFFEKTKAVISLPIMAIDKVIGALWVGRNTPFDKNETGILNSIASIAGSALHRAALHEQLEATINALPDILFELDRDGLIHDLRAPRPDMFHIPANELIGRKMEEIFSEETVSVFNECMAKSSKYGHSGGGVFPLQTPEKTVWFELSTAPKGNPAKKECHFIVLAHDITSRKQAEQDNIELGERLLQAQKMEAIGRLAGGVAHDFNNMLSVILGYSELMQSMLPKDEDLSSCLEEIQKAAMRSSDITRQLLAFSRKQVITPTTTDPNMRVNESLKILERLIGEDIDVIFIPQKDLWKIYFDPSQLDQILFNLAVNARDAMPDGGKLTIETRNIPAKDSLCIEQPDLEPFDYVLLLISDNGTGMDKETQKLIFEPFFTTKETGKGTGLGLATVYGIVKQNNGFIQVDSEPGQGTTFRVYIPRLEENHKIQKVVHPGDAMTGGTGTILLVEDEKTLRQMVKSMLERIGYTILAAANGNDALVLHNNTHTRIDLLLTDVVMPGMNGRQLSELIRKKNPGLGVLFMSGYMDDVIEHHGILEEGINLIQKPFNMNDLAAKIKEVIMKNG